MRRDPGRRLQPLLTSAQCRHSLRCSWGSAGAAVVISSYPTPAVSLPACSRHQETTTQHVALQHNRRSPPLRPLHAVYTDSGAVTANYNRPLGQHADDSAPGGAGGSLRLAHWRQRVAAAHVRQRAAARQPQGARQPHQQLRGAHQGCAGGERERAACARVSGAGPGRGAGGRARQQHPGAGRRRPAHAGGRLPERAVPAAAAAGPPAAAAATHRPPALPGRQPHTQARVGQRQGRGSPAAAGHIQRGPPGATRIPRRDRRLRARDRLQRNSRQGQGGGAGAGPAPRLRAQAGPPAAEGQLRRDGRRCSQPVHTQTHGAGDGEPAGRHAGDPRGPGAGHARRALPALPGPPRLHTGPGAAQRHRRLRLRRRHSQRLPGPGQLLGAQRPAHRPAGGRRRQADGLGRAELADVEDRVVAERALQD